MTALKHAPPKVTALADNKAGAFRLVSLRLSRAQKDKADQSRHFGRYISNFLEAEVQQPYKFRQVSPLAFALNGHCSDEGFELYVLNLYEKLMEFLFGSERDEDVDVLFFSGTDLEVATFLTEPEEKAIARAGSYLSDLKKKHAEKTPDASDQSKLVPMAGKRDLFYRGILALPQNVLLAWAITPSADSSGLKDYRAGDIDLTRYMDFLGKDVMDFTIRLFEKASYYLQTSAPNAPGVVLLIPISYRSLLSGQDMDRFRQAMKEHPAWIRDQMFLSVYNAPTRPSSTVIQKFMGEILHLFRTVDWQITEPHFDINLFLGCRLHSLTFDISRYRTGRTATISVFLNRLEDLRRHRIRPAISGLNSESELLLVTASKMAYVSGDAVTLTLPSPAPAQKVDLSLLPIMEPTVLNMPLDFD